MPYEHLQGRGHTQDSDKAESDLHLDSRQSLRVLCKHIKLGHPHGRPQIHSKQLEFEQYRDHVRHDTNNFLD